MNKTVKTAFKKLLGSGRAWLTPTGFTDGVYDIFVEPLDELKETIKNIKLTHFPVTYTNENNVVNGEELFDITDIDDKTLAERVQEVESQWSTFSGAQTYKQLETILQKKGLPVYVIENIPQGYNLYGARVIGNGYLYIENEVKDPIQIVNGLHTFIIQAYDFIESSTFISMAETLVKIKAAEQAAYVIPYFLRKKNIHNIMTKAEMQTYKKSQYCDVRTSGGF